MHHDTSLIDIIAVGLSLAFVLGALAQRLKLSTLVGYLVAGICVGPFTPGFVADQQIANQLSELGVMLLMFGVGLHFSLEDLLEVKAIAIPGALVQIAAATLLGWGLAWTMGWPMVQGVVFGLALSVASTVVLLRALEERRLIDTQRGRIAVGWLIVEDLVMVLALVLLPALAQMLNGNESVAGHTQNADSDSNAMLTALGWTLLKMTGFVAVMLVVGRRVIPWSLEKVAATGSRELFTLAVLGIALGVAFGSAKLFGVSFALGAFFAGMVLKGSETSHAAATDSLPLRDAFAVLFFVAVGMLFNPAILIEHPFQVLATFLTITIGKSAAAFLIVRAFGHPTSTALTISTSLAQIGEFSFILAGLGIQLAILPETGRDLILAGALLSIIANPFLFTWLDRWQAQQTAEETTLVEPELPPGPSPDLYNHAIVIGYGRVGSMLAQLLQSRHVPLLVIDDNSEHVLKAHAAGIPAIRGSAAADLVLAEAHPERAKIAVLAIPQPLEAGEILAKLRALNPELTLVARAQNDAEVKHLLGHGADATVVAEHEMAHSLAEMVLSSTNHPNSTRLQPAIA
ncbi:Kef family K(+) transporter [Xylella fastidiosa subsp. multiplex]|uniref:Kef family K(+) transporter n=1 Tax=Xylella fastidiosa subsp. multiplex TaxID=644357 RepID=A0A9Q4QSS7_XYLFS|nr:YbaL family putative K(+) efflux transporter [Xylella fastidiosa]ERI59730.1 cation:proton antiport protein [Xylella fastidiosa subsp. multiplex Griffin-1]ACA12275.1 cation:proton antiporter [Xylella fastidiosa M12]KAJ4852003.1 Kef family K(+) transporter [Xylella fastidiosa subsp. multiplex]MBE0269268.1 Kef family K(+) transporter [Xylella fastidiosa subsp. multiplex]MBE0275979.1 Kef family K(+) transporter [Xylella fastidiosa subsp. multiplex]